VINTVPNVWNSETDASVPAMNECTETSPNIAYELMCTYLHSVRGIFFIISEVPWMTISK